ncbi:acetyl-CoA carboxylase biotin carboxyl carrier protein [Micromonospora sp. NPDC047707]|uniref:acetyl-CoA carboxylase biotin carboxyl carrier protein n=1 Tax=Micromonospora sp. NPDC047707 TaxID=3154498 RepID=UPI0034519252
MTAGTAPVGVPATNGGAGDGPAGAGRPSGTRVSAGTGAPSAGGPSAGPVAAGTAAAAPTGTTAAVDTAPAGAVAALRRHVRELVADLDGSVRRVMLRSGDTVLEVEWHPPAESVRPPPASLPSTVEVSATVPPASQPPAAGPARHAVRSPIVGTFYRAPEPGAAPFVAVGDRVHPGQVVGIVEAMKLMNEVTADRAGRVAEIIAADGQPVEYDQPLLALDPA